MAKHKTSSVADKRKPRLLWANPFCLLDTSSGASMTVRQMLLQLVANGYEVQILGATVFDDPKGMRELKKQFPDLSVHLHQLIEVEDGPLTHQTVVSYSHNRSHFTTHEEGLWYGQYLYMLDSFKPDIVWFYGGLTLDMLIADEARDRGIPVAFYLANGHYKSPRWCRDIDLILTDSQATANMYRQEVGFTAKPVGKFITADSFIAHHHERTRLLFVNPSWQKGASIFVQLAEKLESDRPDIELEVVEARADWESVLRHVTKQMGAQRSSLKNVTVTANTRDMRGPYSRARALVAPSLWWESSGRVLAEAMLNGIPALVTNRGGMPEMIGNAGYVFDFPEQCYEEPYQHLLSESELKPLFDAVVGFYDNEAHYQEYVERAWRVGAKKHDIEGATERLLTALSPLASQRAGSRDFSISQKKRHHHRLTSHATKPDFKVDKSLQQLAETKISGDTNSTVSNLNLRDDFTWELKGKIIVIDNRASLLKRGLAAQMSATNAFGIVAFDPASEVDNPAQYDGSETIQLFRHALLGDGSQTMLNACVAPEMTSTLEPLPSEQLPERHHLGAQKLAELPINTIALDSIDGLESLDWLILDELSDALQILDHGKIYLNSTLLLQVRVPFQLTHERQPSLAELQHWASRNGFRFYRFHNIEHYSHLPEKLNHISPVASEQEKADVLFLPSHERMSSLGDEKKIKLAFVLSSVFNAHDMSFDLLADVDKDTAIEFLEAYNILPKANSVVGGQPQLPGPPPPHNEHVSGTPAVTVICPTYNHGPFIEDALKGFVGQRTNFPFEVIVIDDASTDGAQDIIRKYAEAYPDIIIPLLNEENLRSKNKPLPYDMKALVRGKYMAHCEGDDYWVDESKLQQQYDFMEKNPDYSVCYHNAFVFKGNEIVSESKLPENEQRDLSEKDLLLNNCFLLTLSRFFRKDFYFSNAVRESKMIANGDNLTISRLGLEGKGKYLPSIKPAAYRLHENSVWSSRNALDKCLMLSNSLNWIGVFHEREGRDKVAKVYYSQAAALVESSYIAKNKLSSELVEKIEKLGIEKPCDVLEFSSVSNLLFQGSNNVVAEADGNKNTFIVSASDGELLAPGKHYRLAVVNELVCFMQKPKKIARELVRVASAVLLILPSEEQWEALGSVKKILADHSSKTYLLESGSMVLYVLERNKNV